MRVQIAKYACGVAVGWFAHVILEHGSDRSPNVQKTGDVVRVSAVGTALDPTHEPDSSAADADLRSGVASQGEAGGNSRVAGESFSSLAGPSTNDRRSGASLAATASSRELPGLNSQRGATPLEGLSHTTSIRCEFSPGNGANWSDGKIQLHGAAWQGGPIVYDSVNVDAGTAHMTGSEGATGSSTGESNVHVASTSVGLHFWGVTAGGRLIATTIYDPPVAIGRYVAVMSRHADPLVERESAQFYGTCDTAS